MARVFGEPENELRLFDNISGSSIALRYRNPTTRERADYEGACIRRVRNKIEYTRAEARVKYGAIILTGFREGDFERVADGKRVPLSSDPKSPRYCQDWKEQVVANAADLVMALAAHVFDAPVQEDAEAGDADGEGDAEKN
jgi:hypothetical protein